MSDTKPKRPEPGTVTVTERRFKVCSGCGYAIGDTGLCADDCQFDGEFPHPHFEAVYKVTTEFLRDEQK